VTKRSDRCAGGLRQPRWAEEASSSAQRIFPFARRVAHLTETHRELVEDRDGRPTALYRVTGELFFASSNDLYTQFEYAEDPDTVVIDLTASHIWDASTVASLDAITTKYARKGKTVEIVGLNMASAERHQRLTGQLPGH